MFSILCHGIDLSGPVFSLLNCSFFFIIIVLTSYVDAVTRFFFYRIKTGLCNRTDLVFRNISRSRRTRGAYSKCQHEMLNNLNFHCHHLPVVV